MPFGVSGNGEREDSSADQTINFGASAEDKSGADIRLILGELHHVNRRTDRLELDRQRPVSTPHVPRELSPPTSAWANTRSSGHQDPEGLVSSAPTFSSADDFEFNEIQEKLNIIKASVEKVILPTQLKLHDSRSGIKREDHPVLTVVGKCGRYVETALKLLNEVDEGKKIDLGQIAIVLVANYRTSLLHY